METVTVSPKFQMALRPAWQKGQPGRTLTPEDIEHYHRIVVALKETIRLMAEIDEVIEGHGGWRIE